MKYIAWWSLCRSCTWGPSIFLLFSLLYLLWILRSACFDGVDLLDRQVPDWGWASVWALKRKKKKRKTCKKCRCTWIREHSRSVKRALHSLCLCLAACPLNALDIFCRRSKAQERDVAARGCEATMWSRARPSSAEIRSDVWFCLVFSRRVLFADLGRAFEYFLDATGNVGKRSQSGAGMSRVPAADQRIWR